MEEATTEKYSRSEKSLSTLTKKFVQMLQSESVIDLNIACQALDVNKKRRIYDITNVLEGINLIKKVGKNLYSWTGKRESSEIASEDNELQFLKDDKQTLERDEIELNDAIKVMRRNLAAVKTGRSFCYLTKKDFMTAFGADDAVLIAKDYKKIKINFDCDPNEVKSLLVRNHKSATLLNMEIVGDVVKPVHLKLVNAKAKQNCDANLLFCLDDMENEEESGEPTNVQHSENVPKRTQANRSQNLPLFRRRIKPKTLLDLSDDEREKMASTVLECDRFKDKSMFHFINHNQLVSPSDYNEPDFISLIQPVDADYEDNYSIVPPSVHDLFDIEIDDEMTIDDIAYEEVDEDYVMEYLEEDADL